MSNNITALRYRAQDLKTKCKALLDKAKNDDRELNASENAIYQANIEVLKSLEQAIIREEAVLEAERNAEPVTNPNTEAARRAGELGSGSWTATTTKLGARPGPMKYADLFPGAQGNRGFTSFNEFMNVIHSGLVDPRLMRSGGGVQALTGHSEAVPSDGGFLVPEQWSAALLDCSLENEIVRPRASVYPMVTSTRKIAGWDALDNSGGAPFGGFSIEWLNEGSSGTTKKGKTRLIQLTANKAALFTTASNELVEDGMSFDEMLGGALVQSVGWGLDYAFLQGDGAGKPLGVLNDPALITITKETSQVAATIVYENLTKAFARLHSACQPNSVWVANSTTIPQLLQLSVKIKNVAGSENVGGSHIPALTESNGQFKLLTRPVIFTEKLPALGTKGDIILADFSQYAIGLRKQVSVEKSQHIGWQTDETGYRCVMRVDGQGRWSGPFTQRHGSTVSWCVCIETRS